MRSWASPSSLTAVFVMLHEAWSARRDAQIRFPVLQIEPLGARVPGYRVIPHPVSRRRLMKMGALFDHRIEDTRRIACIKTDKRWLGNSSGAVRRMAWPATCALRIDPSVDPVIGPREQWVCRPPQAADPIQHGPTSSVDGQCSARTGQPTSAERADLR